MKNILYAFLFFLTLSNLEAGWEKLNIAYGARVNCISANDSGTVVIGTDRGVYVSYDLGENWNLIEHTDVYGYIRDIAISNDSKIYYTHAGKHKRIDGDTSFIITNNDYKLLYAINSTMLITEEGIIKNDQVELSLVDSTITFYNALKTKDNDLLIFTKHNYTKSNPTYVAFKKDTFQTYQFIDSTWINLNGISIDENNGLYYATYNEDDYSSLIYYSEDTLKTVSLKANISKSDIQDLKYLSDGILVASTSKGIIKSTDKGVTWYETDLKDYLWKFCYTKKTLFAISFESQGVYKSSDMGDTWTEINKGLTNNYFSSVSYYSDSVIIATDDSRLYLISNEGKDCEILYQVKPHYLNKRFTIMNPNVNNDIIIKENPSYLMKINRETKKIDTLLKGYYGSNIIYIDSNYYFYKDRKIFKTPNFKDFQESPIINNKLSNTGRIIKSKYLDRYYLIADSLYYSDDSLKTFIPSGLNHPSTIKNVVENSNGTIFVAQGREIYKRLSGSEQWKTTAFNYFDHDWVEDILLDNNDIIYAATDDKGVYQMNSNINFPRWNKIGDESLKERSVDYLAMDNNANIYGFSEGSGIFIFKQDKNTPFPPNLIFPYEKQVLYSNENVYLRWSDLSQIEYYHCQLAVDDFPKAQFYILDTIVTEVNKLNVNNLKYGWMFYWRVKAKYTNGNESDWSPTWTFRLEPPVSVQNFDETISIYPNPARDVINIKSSKRIGRIKLLDLSGLTLFDSSIENEECLINLQPYSNGFYFIEIENKGIFKIFIAR